MAPNARQILIEIGGARGTARLLDDKAPVACQKLWDALPIEGAARHSRWSGGAAYILVAALKDATYQGAQHAALKLPENFNSFLQAGTINYLAEHGEIVLCYDQAQVRGPEGNGWAARIADLEDDAGALSTALAEVQHAGETRIRITRV